MCYSSTAQNLQEGMYVNIHLLLRVVYILILSLKVQIKFLPVGHTHEDVDQLFSKIGEEIRKLGCESFPGKNSLNQLFIHTFLLKLWKYYLQIFCK